MSFPCFQKQGNGFMLCHFPVSEKQGNGQYPVSEKQGIGQFPVFHERVGFLVFLSLRNQEMCTHVDISVLFFKLIQCKIPS